MKETGTSDTPAPESTEKAPRKLAGSDTPKRRKVIKPLDAILIVGFVIIVVVLVKILTGDIANRHEVSQATALSNQVVSAMEKQDTAKLVSLGTKQFKADHTAAELSDKLTFKTDPPISFAQMYGKNPKRSIAEQTIANTSSGQHVIVLYKYDKLKVPMFVRVIAAKPPTDSHWYLQRLDVSPDASTLLVN